MQFLLLYIHLGRGTVFVEVLTTTMVASAKQKFHRNYDENYCTPPDEQRFVTLLHAGHKIFKKVQLEMSKVKMILSGKWGEWYFLCKTDYRTPSHVSITFPFYST